MTNRLKMALNPMLTYSEQKRFLSAFLADTSINEADRQYAQHAFVELMEKLDDPIIKSATVEEERLAKEHASNRRKLLNNEKD